MPIMIENPLNIFWLSMYKLGIEPKPFHMNVTLKAEDNQYNIL